MQAFFIFVFFYIKDQTRNIIRNLTPYSLYYSKFDAIFILAFFTTVESRQQFSPIKITHQITLLISV